MKLMVCLPGNTFPAEFFCCYIRFTQWLIKNKIQYVINQASSYSIFEVRNKCLQGDYTKGPDQLPFNGDKYDKLLWLDSDIIFTPEQIETLLNTDKQVIAALYRTKKIKEYACGNIEGFTKPFIQPAVAVTDEYIKAHPAHTPIKVDYTGFGACVMKQGVIESISFPWFKPGVLTTLVDGVECSSIPTEDVLLFRELAKKGISAYVHPDVVVGHLKSFVI